MCVSLVSDLHIRGTHAHTAAEEKNLTEITQAAAAVPPLDGEEIIHLYTTPSENMICRENNIILFYAVSALGV